jgi:hypothetical protein
MLVTRPPTDDDAAHVDPSGQTLHIGDELELSITVPLLRVPLLVVFLPLGSWWIRDRSGCRPQGVKRPDRYTGPRRQVRSA